MSPPLPRIPFGHVENTPSSIPKTRPKDRQKSATGANSTSTPPRQRRPPWRLLFGCGSGKGGRDPYQLIDPHLMGPRSLAAGGLDTRISCGDVIRVVCRRVRNLLFG